MFISTNDKGGTELLVAKKLHVLYYTISHIKFDSQGRKGKKLLAIQYGGTVLFLLLSIELCGFGFFSFFLSFIRYLAGARSSRSSS